jgi:hypothetical protein
MDYTIRHRHSYYGGRNHYNKILLPATTMAAGLEPEGRIPTRRRHGDGHSIANTSELFTGQLKDFRRREK